MAPHTQIGKKIVGNISRKLPSYFVSIFCSNSEGILSYMQSWAFKKKHRKAQAQIPQPKIFKLEAQAQNSATKSF